MKPKELEFEIITLADIHKKVSYVHDLLNTPDCYHLSWLEKGKLSIYQNFDLLKLRSNALTFLNRNSITSFELSADTKGIVILFTEDFFCTADSDIKFLQKITLSNLFLNSSPTVYINPNKENHLPKLLELITDEFSKAPDASQRLLLKNYLYNLLLLFDRKKESGQAEKLKDTPEISTIYHFYKLLEEQFQSEKRVSTYAQNIGITKKSLNNAIFKVTKKMPKDIIQDRVILESKRLLIYTNFSIKEIGFKLGFNETTNFVKYFRLKTNYTPMQFRNDNKNIQ